MLSYFGGGDISWKSFGLQGDQISQSQRKSTLNFHWKDWCWSWSSSILNTWCEEPTLENTLMLGKIEGRRRGWQRINELDDWPNGHEFEQTLEDREAHCATDHRVSKSWARFSHWTIENLYIIFILMFCLIYYFSHYLLQ